MLRYLYSFIGEFRFPLRLRGHYLKKALASNSQPRRIWDAGCGEGHTSFCLARYYPNAQILGTDINFSAIEHCRKIAEVRGADNTQFECQDLEKQGPGHMAGFDMIVCYEVLEHICDFHRALQVMAENLNEKGCLFIHTPAAGRFQSSTFGLRRYLGTGTPSMREGGQLHIRTGFEFAELVRSVENAGLFIVEARYTFGSLSMFAHTIYEATRPCSKVLQIVTFPLLIALGWLDDQVKHCEGGGIFVLAQKRSNLVRINHENCDY